MILLYDSTFEGFLSLIYEVYYKKLKPTNIYKTLPNEIIFDEVKTIETNEENYKKVLEAIKTKFTKNILADIIRKLRSKFEFSPNLILSVGDDFAKTDNDIDLDGLNKVEKSKKKWKLINEINNDSSFWIGYGTFHDELLWTSNNVYQGSIYYNFKINLC